VIATEPDSAATGIPIGADVAITFSESMDRASVLDWILISPPRDFSSRSWKGDTFRLSGGEDFEPNVTITVVVGVGCRSERERVPMNAPHLFVFSTGDSIDSGRIDGRLIAHGAPAHGVMVWALDMEEAAARTDTLLPDYLTQVAADSTFTFLGLKPGRRYLILAHGDANRDREFDRELDFVAVDPTPVWLDASSPIVRGVAIDFRNPRSPGVIAGKVQDPAHAALDSARAKSAAPADTARVPAPPDSTRLRIEVRAELVSLVTDSLSTRWAPTPLIEDVVAPADTTAADTLAAASAAADSVGRYELKNLQAGFYRVSAFLDRNRNRRYDAGEPAAIPVDSVRVKAGERTGDIDLVLPASAEPESESPVPPAPDRPRGP
jgi:uncharacterized protein (DUF2141 family)